MELPLPEHFDAGSAGDVRRVDYKDLSGRGEAWATKHGIRVASTDTTRVCLLLVDVQNTFCLPDFELFVGGRSGRGAVDDTARTCAWIYRNLGRITHIVATMDTHTALQIFHPMFWVDEEGRHPAGGETIITLEDLDSGRWRPNPAVAKQVAGGDLAWLERYARHYVTELAEGRYPLMVWPYHAMLGGVGHALVGSVEEAIFFHSVARETGPSIEVKGTRALTENYSVFRPEVTTDPEGAPVGAVNESLVADLLAYDAVVVAGQAKSHCVAWTVSDLLAEIERRAPHAARRIYLLDDCSSAVVVPGVVDFTDQAEEAFARFAEAGMHRVVSTTSVDDWPDWPGA